MRLKQKDELALNVNRAIEIGAPDSAGIIPWKICFKKVTLLIAPSDKPENGDILTLRETERLKADALAVEFFCRWHHLCENYLPLKSENSIWRYSGERRFDEPSQGWKIHISVTVLQACDLFEKVAPFLASQNIQFKAPKSLDELSKINCGLQYGYQQIGKFLTIYPSNEDQFIRLAGKLHKLTEEFSVIYIPFDEQYLPESSVFYRYGELSRIEMTDEEGKIFPAIKNNIGKFVPDDRFRAIPAWLSDPFQNNKIFSAKTFVDTPLGTNFKVFRAITQRGKGGTYEAYDFSSDAPRLCIVKEGRLYGEIDWNGQDGYFLVRNEFEVLSKLRKHCEDVPQVFSSFEIYGNFYLAMEYIEGNSLYDVMKIRRRRFSIKRVLWLALEIVKMIENIQKAGWIWNDCKPANIIITRKKTLRPIDFESAYPINQNNPFNWKTKGFSKSANDLNNSDGKSDELYALGAVIYFLLTGRLYDEENPIPIGKLRRGVPFQLQQITEQLLLNPDMNISGVREEIACICLN